MLEDKGYFEFLVVVHIDFDIVQQGFEYVENRCRPCKTERVNFKATLLCTLQKFSSIVRNPVITT